MRLLFLGLSAVALGRRGCSHHRRRGDDDCYGRSNPGCQSSSSDSDEDYYQGVWDTFWDAYWQGFRAYQTQVSKICCKAPPPGTPCAPFRNPAMPGGGCMSPAPMPAMPAAMPAASTVRGTLSPDQQTALATDLKKKLGVEEAEEEQPEEEQPEEAEDSLDGQDKRVDREVVADDGEKDNEDVDEDEGVNPDPEI